MKLFLRKEKPKSTDVGEITKKSHLDFENFNTVDRPLGIMKDGRLIPDYSACVGVTADPRSYEDLREQQNQNRWKRYIRRP